MGGDIRLDAGSEGHQAWRAPVRWSGMVLVAVTWFSAIVFGAYIVSFFGGAALRGTPERWNESLPALFDRAGLAGTAAIGAHFLARDLPWRLPIRSCRIAAENKSASTGGVEALCLER